MQLHRCPWKDAFRLCHLIIYKPRGVLLSTRTTMRSLPIGSSSTTVTSPGPPSLGNLPRFSRRSGRPLKKRPLLRQRHPPSRRTCPLWSGFIPSLIGPRQLQERTTVLYFTSSLMRMTVTRRNLRMLLS